MAIDEALLRFLDPSANVRDIQITPGTDGGYRFATIDKTGTVATYAQALAVGVGTTVTLLSNTALSNKRYSGIYVTGETDATFTVKLNGNIIMMSKINQINKDKMSVFPNPYPALVSDVLLVEVTNSGIQTSDFECILYEAQ